MARSGANPRRDAFVAWMALLGVNTTQVAKAAGISYTTLASFVQGDTRSLKGENETKIANAYDVPIAEIFEGSSARPRPRRTVPLVGYVGAGAEAHYYERADLGEVDAPDSATPQTVAAEIKGPSLGPIFDTWLIFWDDVRTPVTTDQIGRLCIVGLVDGKVLVKRLRHATEGRYHLESNAEPTMYDQEVSWAARVTGMTPR